MRRAIRSSAILGTAALALLGTIPTAGGALAADSEEKARNVILLIADGMGTTHVDAARQRIAGANGQLSMEQLANTGSVSTYSVLPDSDKPNSVPDSAATATAWSSGVKSYNGAIGKDAYGDDVPLIMEQAQAAGMRTGNVSTAEITDATPAAAMAHAFKRQCQGPTPSGCSEGEANIADQISRNGTADVILGGGLKRFEPDDQAALEEQGYRVLGDFGDETIPADQGLQTAETQQVATAEDLAAVPADTERLVALFNRGNLTVEQSKQLNPDSPEAAEPTLPEMTSKAIELLSASSGAPGESFEEKYKAELDGYKEKYGDQFDKYKDTYKDKYNKFKEQYDADRAGEGPGFFLQVESALVDKRSHANDAAQTLEEMRYFDQSVQVARDFAASDAGKGTLVIVSADHECAGFNIIGTGSFTNAEALNPPGNVDSSNEANTSTPRREYADNVRDEERSTGPVNGAGSGDPGNFAPATFRTPEDPEGVRDGDPEASLWLTYLSGNHTGASVPVFSEGPGSSALDGRVDQTDLYGAMTAALSGQR